MIQLQYLHETQRKDQLLTLLERHEDDVFDSMLKPSASREAPFERTFNGLVEVERVGKSSVRLKRDNGRPLGILMVTPEIAALVNKGDELTCILGLRKGQWHLIHITMIGSRVGYKGKQQTHLSVSMKEPPAIQAMH